MEASIDLTGLEQRVYRSRFGDGLADVLLGLFITLMGITFMTDVGGLGGVWGAMLLPMWKPLHDKLIVPRLGYVTFTRARRGKIVAKQLILALALGVSMLAGVVLWLLNANADGASGWLARVPDLGPTPFGVMLAALVAVSARLLSLSRGYGYAALIIVAVTGGHVLGLELGLSLSLVGGFIFVAGAVILTRFLREHPVIKIDEFEELDA
ncbi:MAG: hypothetical protein DRQ55_05585 [Planctomycetota bacterium]|nr:MAG: hypothetical protein DRQ55_05585 [Planctomycetota bacterium]